MRALFSPDKSFHLERFDEHDIDDFPGEIYAFMLLRNEIAALPFLFTYYRNMGVKRFFMIDDHSEDGTREYLLAQPDTHVFTPSNPFGQANSGNNWLNLLLDRFGTGHWTLVVDADELLIYPHCEKSNFPIFARIWTAKAARHCLPFCWICIRMAIFQKRFAFRIGRFMIFVHSSIPIMLSGEFRPLSRTVLRYFHRKGWLAGPDSGSFMPGRGVRIFFPKHYSR